MIKNQWAVKNGLALAAVALLAGFLTGCPSKERANPFDPYNGTTHGDPFHLKAEVVGTGIELTWEYPETLVPYLDRFHILRSPFSNGAYQFIGNSQASQRVYTDDAGGLTSGKRYYYKVLAVDHSENESAPSAALGVTNSINPPVIALSKDTLVFTAIRHGAPPEAQTFTITNDGDGTLNWSVSDDATTLEVNPTGPSNSNQAVITCSITTTNLPLEFYEAAITINSNNAVNAPKTVAVIYRITSP